MLTTNNFTVPKAHGRLPNFALGAGCNPHYHPGMSPYDFLRKWQQNTQKERSSSQSHFNDLCALLGLADPATADPDDRLSCSLYDLLIGFIEGRQHHRMNQ